MPIRPDPSQTLKLSKSAVHSRSGVVAAQHLDAAEVGAEVLAAGGNAVDAAIATSFMLAALEPWMSGPGGGGFMVVAPADGAQPQVVDFAMVAPQRLDPAAFPLAAGRDTDLFGWPAVEGQRNVNGPLAVAVPGHVAGLATALERFGTMPWAELLAPATEQAKTGCPVSWHTTLRIAVAARELAGCSGRDVYLPGGLPPAPEQGALPLPRLAGTLERLASAGSRDLYDGDLARALVADLQNQGAWLDLDDLGRYHAKIVAALAVPYGGATVFTAAGLSAGPTLGRALGGIEGRIPDGPPGAEARVMIADALFEAYEHRLATMGDVDDAVDPACTTHLCVVDRDGMMVSLTQTLLSVFGSKVVSPSTGILMNNGIMWFDPRPGRPNSIGPGKRPLSNMCPVVVQRDRRPWLAIGASGGRRIMPAILQLTSMAIDHGLDLETAFHTPRINVSGEPWVEADPALAGDVLAALRARHEVVPAPHDIYPSNYACPLAVMRTADGRATGMADPVQPHAGAAAASS